MTRDQDRREFVEWIFAAASDRWIMFRCFGVQMAAIPPEEIINEMVDRGLAEWVDVEPTSNDYGATLLPLMIRSRPADEVREAQRARVRRAIDRIQKEIGRGSEGGNPKK